MLRFRDVALNRGRLLFDICTRMSLPNNNTNVQGPDGSGSSATPDAADQMAHELANLLDGSLRHLGIVIDTLREGVRLELVDAKEDTGSTALLSRLETTDRAMRQMVSLIHAWMRRVPDPIELFDRAQTLGQMLEEAVRLHGPSAKRYGIDLTLRVDDSAGGLSAGPIFPVVANGLRNAIEAISGAGERVASGAYVIETVATVFDGRLCLMVRDNGPGLDASLVDAGGVVRLGHTTKGGGHGLGLTLSRQIARSLDGTLEINARDTGGVELVLCCPVSSLTSSLMKSDHA